MNQMLLTESHKDPRHHDNSVDVFARYSVDAGTIKKSYHKTVVRIPIFT